MGNSLPKDLINAERAKLQSIEGSYSRKTYDFENFRNFHAEENWEAVTIKIHQAKLVCEFNEEIEIYSIDCDFLIINQSHSNKECVIALMAERKLWKIQANTLREFMDLTNCLIQSKIPSWSISPVCQICSKTFNLTKRRHHCRNCGKNICKKCNVRANIAIEGFYKLKKICVMCQRLIKQQIEAIEALQKQEAVKEASSRSLLLPSSHNII